MREREREKANQIATNIITECDSNVFVTLLFTLLAMASVVIELFDPQLNNR